jgi:hypothetical protein
VSELVDAMQFRIDQIEEFYAQNDSGEWVSEWVSEWKVDKTHSHILNII